MHSKKPHLNHHAYPAVSHYNLTERDNTRTAKCSSKGITKDGPLVNH